jgi:hypothetical protein
LCYCGLKLLQCCCCGLYAGSDGCHHLLLQLLRLGALLLLLLLLSDCLHFESICRAHDQGCKSVHSGNKWPMHIDKNPTAAAAVAVAALLCAV